MATEVFKGIAATVSAKLAKGNVPIPFVNAVRYNVINSVDKRVLTGVATNTGGGVWSANITIPDTYPLTNNASNEDLLVEFYGKDTSGVERSREVYVNLLDSTDDYVPEGILGFIHQKTPIYDYLLLANKPLVTDSIDTAIVSVGGNEFFSDSIVPTSIAKVRGATDVPGRFEGPSGSTGYMCKLQLPELDGLPESTMPYQVMYEYQNETYMHSLYWVNRRILSMLSSVKMYLDKANLKEIDPTLQWHDTEIVNSIYQGLQAVNSFPNDLTHWKFSDFPMQLNSYWEWSSIIHALNTRYLAEGMNAFEFQGLSTSLNYDRKEALSYKIEELKGYMENLRQAKISAVRTSGSGIPDSTLGITPGSGFKVGLMHLTLNPLNNVRGRRGSTTSRVQRMLSGNY